MCTQIAFFPSLSHQWSKYFHVQILPFHILSLNASMISVNLRRKTATRIQLMWSPVNGTLSSASASVFLSLDQSLGVICYVSSLQSQSSSWKAVVCFIDNRGRSGRWVNNIDLGIWDWAKINSVERMIKLTLSYVLHHQLFGLWSQILLRSKVRHQGFFRL